MAKTMSDYVKVTQITPGGYAIQGKFSTAKYHINSRHHCRREISEYTMEYEDQERWWIGDMGTAGQKAAMERIESIGGKS